MLKIEKKGFSVPEQVTNELIYEVLKSMQSRLDKHERLLIELNTGQTKIREDIHELRGV